MNILFIGNYLTNSNPNLWQELTLKLHDAGHSIYTSSDKNNQIHRMMDMLAIILRKKQMYDVAEVDVFSGKAFIFAYLSARLLTILKKPFILTLHGGKLPDFSRQHPALVRKLLNSADVVVVPSAYLLKEMQQYRTDLRLIPNAINLSNYPYILREHPTTNLVWLRAFHKIYNPQLVINSLASLIKSVPETHLYMIGPDKQDGSFQQTKKMVAEMGLESKVTFTGKIPKSEVPLWLNKGDIFINTSMYDNTPISVMEAMACGLCVISTNVGGMPYLIDHMIDGLLVPPDDPASIVNSLNLLQKEPELARNISSNARKKIEKFDWSEVLPQWELLFQSLIRHQ